jgi:hypothetical protein
MVVGLLGKLQQQTDAQDNPPTREPTGFIAVDDLDI